MTPFTITINREQLFGNVCQLTLYATEQLKDQQGISQVDSYLLGETERELYATIDEEALYILYDRCQILFRDTINPVTISPTEFTISGNIPSDLPIDMVALSMQKALTENIMSLWWKIRRQPDLQQKFEVRSEESLMTLKSRILSRNTKQITYRGY